MTGTIKTKRLILREFSLNDADDVFEYASDKKTVEYLTWYAHKDKQETKSILEKFFINNENCFCIDLNGKCIGCLDLRINAEHEKVSFGYVLNRMYWGQGYMTEVLTAIIDFVFNELKYNRIESTHYAGNEASGRVMQKAGMKHEGTGKQEVKIKGHFFDVLHYGLTREDF